MAFDYSKLSGAVGGFGKAPALFTYLTADTALTVTTAGYFNELAGGLSKNDIILATVDIAGTPNTIPFVVTQAEYIDGQGFVTDVDYLLTSFTGDTDATDTAGYQSDNFSGNIGAGGLKFDLIIGATGNLYTYRNNTDTMATINTAGYFDDLAEALNIGDIILTVSGDDGGYNRVTDITAGVVTTTAIAFA